jgi:general nucleoside transport system permease protein
MVGALSMTLAMGDVVAGIVTYFGALGLTGFLVARWFPGGATIGSRRLTPLWGSTGQLDFVLRQTPLVYLTVALTIALVVFLRTSLGLRVRACGESLVAARSLGIAVRTLRFGVYAVAGAIAGLAGAFVGLVTTSTFDPGIVGGRGFVAIACVILGAWRPGWVVSAAFFFGAADAYRFQADVGELREWLLMLPFALTILAVAWAGEKAGPAEEGRGL